MFPIVDAVPAFFLIALAAACAVADEPVVLNEFTPQALSADSREAILERARFIQQDSSDRLQLNAGALRSMNAVPRATLAIGKTTIHLTHPFAFYGGRQLALAFVEVDSEIYVRVLYRSNSQFTWRMCDATDGGHIGKGFHEFDKQMPISVTVALLKLHNEPQILKAPTGIESRSPSALAKLILQGLTVDRRSEQCISEADGSYYTREYASFIPSQPMAFSRIRNWLTTTRGARIADPAAVDLPPREKLPNLQMPVLSFGFFSPAYAAENDGDGDLVGRVFRSSDETTRYLFFEDSRGRAVLSAVESVLPEVNAMGLRGRYLDTRGMDAPLIEYFQQIPEEFGGSKEPGYRSNWKYVRELPIIKYYYAGQNREVPILGESFQ